MNKEIRCRDACPYAKKIPCKFAECSQDKDAEIQVKCKNDGHVVIATSEKKN